MARGIGSALLNTLERLNSVLPTLKVSSLTSFTGFDKALTQTVQSLTGRDPGSGVHGNRVWLHEALAELAEGPQRIRDALWEVAHAQVEYNNALTAGKDIAEKMASLERSLGRAEAEKARLGHAEARYQQAKRNISEAEASTGTFHKLSRVAEQAGVSPEGTIGKGLQIGRMAEMAAATGDVAGPIGLAISLGVEQFIQKMSLIGSSIGHGVNAITAPEAEQSMKEAADAAADFATAMDPTLGALARFTGVLLLSPVFLKDMAQNLLDVNLQLSNFSGAMAIVGAQHEIRTIQREMSQGQTQAASAERLQNSLDNLKDTLAPLESEIEKFKNDLFAKLTEVADKAASPVTEALTKMIEEMNKQLFGDAKVNGDEARQWFDQLGKGWKPTLNRPPGFDNAPPGVNG